MPELNVFNQEGKEVGKVHLKGELWEGEIHPHVLHLALRRQLAGKRAGTHSTKTRDEVSGTGRKPWKQKGTGRARSGSVRSPLWRHGGVVFGPHPRKHGFAIPKQVRALSLQSALRNLAHAHKLVILDKLEIAEAKTKHAAEILKKLKAERALILVKERNQKLEQVFRNLQHVKILHLSRLNVHDLLRFKKVILTKDTLKALEGVIA